MHEQGLLVFQELVPERGLEPPRPCDHCDLNAARLPVPPLGHECEEVSSGRAGVSCCEAFSFCPALIPLSTRRARDRKGVRRHSWGVKRVQPLLFGAHPNGSGRARSRIRFGLLILPPQPLPSCHALLADESTVEQQSCQFSRLEFSIQSAILCLEIPIYPLPAWPAPRIGSNGRSPWNLHR